MYSTRPSGVTAQSQIGSIGSAKGDMTQTNACREQIATLKADLKQLELKAQELKVQQQELTTDRQYK
jgi:hypothetical protein